MGVGVRRGHRNQRPAGPVGARQRRRVLPQGLGQRARELCKAPALDRRHQQAQRLVDGLGGRLAAKVDEIQAAVTRQQGSVTAAVGHQFLALRGGAGGRHAHHVWHQHDLVAGQQARQHPGSECTVGVVHLVEVVHHMAFAAPAARRVGLHAQRQQALARQQALRDGRHQQAFE